MDFYREEERTNDMRTMEQFLFEASQNSSSLVSAHIAPPYLAVVVTVRKLGIDHTDGPHFGRVPERSRLCVNMLAVHRTNGDGEVDRACNHTRFLKSSRFPGGEGAPPPGF